MTSWPLTPCERMLNFMFQACMFIRAGIGQGRKRVVLGIGIFLLVSTVSAQVSDSSASRFFLQFNTAYRRMNMEDINLRYFYYGLYKNPIHNSMEISAYSGLMIGKNKEGYLKAGFNYIPGIRRKAIFGATDAYDNDSFTLIRFTIYESIFRIRSYTLEGGYFYSISKIKTEIGFGLSLNTIRRMLSSSQFYTSKYLQKDGSIYYGKSDTTQNAEPEDIMNWGGGGFFSAGAGYPLSKHITFTTCFRFFFAAIPLRYADGSTVGIYSPSRFSIGRRNALANLSGFSVGGGFRYNL